MLSNSKKSSPIPLPLRELKDAETYLNTYSNGVENTENDQQQSAKPVPLKKFKAPVMKTAGVTCTDINHTDSLRLPIRAAPSNHVVKKFTPSFKAEPQTVQNNDPCPSSGTKRFFKAMFTK